MSQHDYVISNDSGATVRADINSVLQAVLSQNSGTSAPTTTSAGMFWMDTTGGAPYELKIRDAGNNHWLTLASVTDPGADGNLELLPSKINLPSSGGVYESDGSTEILTESSGAVTLKNTAIDSTVTMSANQSAVKTALNASGSASIYACRAWVNFNGQGTVVIRDSGNVSSITDSSTGQYIANFTNAMPDADYVMGGTSGNVGSTTATRGITRNGSWTTSQAQFRVIQENSTAVDDWYVGIAFFR